MTTIHSSRLWVPGTIAPGATASNWIGIPGAKPGDPAVWGFQHLNQSHDVRLSAHAFTDGVQCFIENRGTTPITLPGGVMKCVVHQF